MKNLPEEVLYYQDNYPPSLDQLQRAAKSVVNNLEGLEVLLWDTNRTLPILEQSFQNSSIEDHRLVYARILGMLGNSTGWQVLCNAVDQYQEWDDGWNYRGMHQFGKSLSYLDSLIIALGRTKVDRAYPSIARMANKLIPASELSHFHAIAISLESIGHKDGANVLFKLLNMPGIMGHAMTDIRTAKKITPENPIDNSTRNNSLRELFLGRALFRVGDKNGLGKHILETYSKDLRGHYYRHANGVLEMFKR
jgi:hypothetical protein